MASFVRKSKFIQFASLKKKVNSQRVARSFSHLVKQCLGIEHKDHIDQNSPNAGMTAHHVQQHLTVDGIDLLGQLGVLVERALDGGPVLVVNQRD